MGKFGDSARELGHRFGVNADVMNVALRNAGILEGEPGSWRITPATEEWVTERDFTNGRHPDERQNPYFSVRQFKTEMVDSIGLTAEDVAAAKLEVAARRAAQSAQLQADRAQADADFLASQTAESSDVDVDASGISLMAGLIIAGIVVGVGVGTYLVIKHVPPVRRRWDDKVAPRLARWIEKRQGMVDAASGDEDDS